MNQRDIIRLLMNQINIFQKHPHEVVKILMKGFSRTMVRMAFSDQPVKETKIPSLKKTLTALEIPTP